MKHETINNEKRCAMKKINHKDQLIRDLIDRFENELKEVNIFRTAENHTQTLGVIIVKNENDSWRLPEVFYTLELPWKENRRNISRIPAGEYEAIKYYSPKHKRIVILLLDVPERTSIEIHPGNTIKDTTGCILVGCARADINNDGKSDVARSKQAMDRLLYLLPGDFRVKIWDSLENKS
jgi:hypothetical protein